MYDKANLLDFKGLHSEKENSVTSGKLSMFMVEHIASLLKEPTQVYC